MSLYSTPLVSVCEDDSVSSEDSFYFTPEVSSTSSTPSTPERSVRSSVSSRRTKSVSDINDVTPVSSPSLSNPARILNNDVNFRINKWNPADDEENHYCSVPTKTLIECTPKRCKSTPLRCITNIVSPIQVKSNPLKFDDQIIQFEKEIIKSALNNSFEATSPVYKNNLLNQKSKYRAKNVNKNKFTFLQRIGIRSKTKMEYDRLIEDSVSPQAISSRKINDSANSRAAAADPQRLIKSENDNANSPSKSSITAVKIMDESCLSLGTQKELKDAKSTLIWWNFSYYPKVLVLKRIRFSPVKRLFSRCRREERKYICRYLTESPKRRIFYSNLSCHDLLKSTYSNKLSDYRFRNLFVNKQLDKEPASSESNTAVQPNPCLCSATALQNQELLSKILLKLNALEEQISDIKYSVKNNKSSGTMSVSCLPPPPPPPPPPLPNFITTSTEVLKRNVMTPKTGQAAKGPIKTQFAITVEDIKSVKLRKTPSSMKRSLAGTSQSPSIKDGVVHSVKFKPVKRTVVQKRELSNIVSEILSPSHKTDQGERNCVVNAKLLEDKENSTISTNFEITPIKSKSVKFRATKRRDMTLDSPTRKRMNTAHRNLIFCDNRVLRYD